MSQRSDVMGVGALDREAEQRPATAGAKGATATSGAGASPSAQTGPKRGGAASKPSGGASASSSGADVAGEVRQTATHLASRATDFVGNRISSQKGRLAAGVGSVASAIRESGDKLAAGNESGVDIRPLLGAAADRVDMLSSYLDERELGELVDDVEALARRRPALFFAGAFALGFLAARFVRSSDSYARRGTRGGAGRRAEVV